MELRTCLNSGLQLSVLGTGCWTFGGGAYWGDINQKDITNVVHASVDQGINYFDTAEVYNDGRSESSLGKALSGIPREKVHIGTRVSPSNCYPIYWRNANIRSTEKPISNNIVEALNSVTLPVMEKSWAIILTIMKALKMTEQYNRIP